MGKRKTILGGAAAFALMTMSIVAQELSTTDLDANDARLLVQNSAPAAMTPAPESSTTEKKNLSVATVSAEPKPTPSQNVTINLIHRLVERGVLTKEDADELIKQAEQDAVTAREMAKKRAPSSVENEVASQYYAEPTPIPSSAGSTTRLTARSEPAAPAEGDDAVSVSYVPEVVKEELREEIRQEVMEQARSENWANPRTFPPWVLRLTPFMDVRLRYEGIFFPSGNDTSGSTFQFVNFNAINTGAPFNLGLDNTTPLPQLDVDKDRERGRIRVRFGAQMDLEDGFTMGLRIATGETNTPTSTNQSFGVANSAQGGNFSKYAVWLDRAFVKYELGGKPSEDFVAEVGRFDNPYFSVSELVWDTDLGWDGLALTGKYRIGGAEAPSSPSYSKDDKGIAISPPTHQTSISITPFATAGIFPVFDTELNFSSNRPEKFSSEDKFLYGVQLGTGLRFNNDFSAKIAGGFFHFYNIEGKLSDPCLVVTGSDPCNTDDSRPSFAQHGNTYFPIRNIIPTVDNVGGTTKQFQYFGLATPFRIVNVDGTLDFAHFDPVHMTLFGEWIENVAFDWEDINRIALNNRGPNRPSGSIGSFDGGDVGWTAGLKVGRAALQKRWDWNVGVDYRWIESDATVDAFNDSDFGLGGTNLKGYEVFGAIALSPRISIGLRWMSANAIAGPPYRNDIVQFDFNAKF